MLSERNQIQKATYYMIPWIGYSQNRQETESRLVATRGWGEETVGNE
jgi:hypothetical protein